MGRQSDEFLESQKVLRLGTADARGVPHLVPVWYLYRGGVFHVGTNSRTKKARNIAGNPRASFCVDVGINAPGIYGVAGHGTAALVLDPARVRKTATDILLRYFGSLNARAQELLDGTDCIIELTPEHVTSWSY